jgi:predicted alpha-1,2-mannosidase
MWLKKMKPLFGWLVLLVTASAVATVVPEEVADVIKVDACKQYDLVDPFIGTGGFGWWGYGALSPAAQVPHGAMRLGPDTTSTTFDGGNQHYSGYYYDDDIIRAFSHTHVVGGAIRDWGTFGLMPIRLTNEGQLPRHDLPTRVGAFKSRFWWSLFKKTSEFARPGHYHVHLDKPQVSVDLLAISTHAGIHKYLFKATPLSDRIAPGFVLDMCQFSGLSVNFFSDSRCAEGSMAINDAGDGFTGSVRITGTFTRSIWVHIYGEIKTSRPAESNNVVDKEWLVCNGITASCTASHTGTVEDGILYAVNKLGATHGRTDFEIEIAVGISFIDVDHAKNNLIHSLGGRDIVTQFELMRQTTATLWCDSLESLDMSTLDGDEMLSKMLYSAVYHSRISPTSYTEVGGEYVGADKVVHNGTSDRLRAYGDHMLESPNSYNYYSDLSLWDTFRTLHPFLLLIDEDTAVGIARSTADITIAQGAFPRWVMAANEANCMIGNSGSALILEAVKAGFGDEIDVKSVQQALQKQSTEYMVLNNRPDVDFYNSQGYVSVEGDARGPALTMTNAFDDYILAGISTVVGANDDAAAALNRSMNYKNVFSQDREYICPRSTSGEWLCVDNPQQYRYWSNYVEGSSLHWTYFVPHDPKGLISLFKSQESFVAHLDEFMRKSIEFEEEVGPMAPNQYFWVGNEHDALSPWLFNFGPNCTKTQYYTRLATHLSFSDRADGIPGNDDYGATSTWLLFASLGLFPQSGTTNYLIGSPRVSGATVRLRHYRGHMSTLDVITYDNSAENVYVSKLLVNGQEYNEAIIDRSVLVDVKGCKLEYYMSKEPISGLCS